MSIVLDNHELEAVPIEDRLSNIHTDTTLVEVRDLQAELSGMEPERLKDLDASLLEIHTVKTMIDEGAYILINNRLVSNLDMINDFEKHEEFYNDNVQNGNIIRKGNTWHIGRRGVSLTKLINDSDRPDHPLINNNDIGSYFTLVRRLIDQKKGRVDSVMLEFINNDKEPTPEEQLAIIKEREEVRSRTIGELHEIILDKTVIDPEDRPTDKLLLLAYTDKVFKKDLGNVLKRWEDGELSKTQIGIFKSLKDLPKAPEYIGSYLERLLSKYLDPISYNQMSNIIDPNHTFSLAALGTLISQSFKNFGRVFISKLANSLESFAGRDIGRQWVDEVLRIQKNKANFIQTLKVIPDRLRDNPSNVETSWDYLKGLDEITKHSVLATSAIASQLSLFREVLKDGYYYRPLPTLGTADEQWKESLTKLRVSDQGQRDKIVSLIDDLQNPRSQSISIGVRLPNTEAQYFINIPMQEIIDPHSSIEEVEVKIMQTIKHLLEANPTEIASKHMDTMIYDAITLSHDPKTAKTTNELKDIVKNAELEKFSKTICNIDLTQVNLKPGDMAGQSAKLIENGRNKKWNVSGNTFAVSYDQEGNPVVVKSYDHSVIDGVVANQVTEANGVVMQEKLIRYATMLYDRKGQLKTDNLAQFELLEFKSPNVVERSKRILERLKEQRSQGYHIVRNYSVQFKNLQNFIDGRYAGHRGLKGIMEDSEDISYITGISPNNILLLATILTIDDPYKNTFVMVDRSNQGQRVDAIGIETSGFVNDLALFKGVLKLQAEELQGSDIRLDTDTLVGSLHQVMNTDIGEKILLSQLPIASPILYMKAAFDKIYGDDPTGDSDDLGLNYDMTTTANYEVMNTFLADVGRDVFKKLFGNFDRMITASFVLAQNPELASSAFGAGDSMVSLGYNFAPTGDKSLGDYEFNFNVNWDREAMLKKYRPEVVEAQIASFETNLRANINALERIFETIIKDKYTTA